jgi:tetratricopeptide (TPR) repeat protein
VGIWLSDLAKLYTGQGRYAEAEPLYHRALQIVEEAWPDHEADVAGVLNGLAVHYQAQGRLIEAEPLFRRALGIEKRRLGRITRSLERCQTTLRSYIDSKGVLTKPNRCSFARWES